MDPKFVNGAHTTNDPDENPHDPPMQLSEHLVELRKRLLITGAWIFGVFMAATTIEVEMDQPILTLFRHPLASRNIPLVFDQLTEPIFTYMRIGLYASLFLTFPITLSQAWLFIKPALFPKEQKLFWPFFIFTYPLFIGGGLFGYFIALPMCYDFFLSFQNVKTLPSLQMGAYLSLTTQMLFGFGCIFELPLVALFFTRMGVIDAAWLRENRRYSIVVIFIVAAILTPPDVISQMMMAIPLLILYEISVVIAHIVGPAKEDTPTAEAQKSRGT